MAGDPNPTYRSKAGDDAVSMLRGQLRVTRSAALILLDTAAERPELEFVIETRVHTADFPSGTHAGATRWVLAYNPDRTRVKLTRTAAEVIPRRSTT